MGRGKGKGKGKGKGRGKGKGGMIPVEHVGDHFDFGFCVCDFFG